MIANIDCKLHISEARCEARVGWPLALEEGDRDKWVDTDQWCMIIE